MLPLVSRRQSSPPPPFSIPLWGQLISHEHVNIYTRTAAIFMFAPAEYCCPLPLPLPLPHSKIPTTPKSQQTIQPTTVFSLSPRSPRNPTIAELVLGNQTSDPQDQSQLVRQPRRVSAIRTTRKSHSKFPEICVGSKSWFSDSSI